MKAYTNVGKERHDLSECSSFQLESFCQW